MSSCRCFSRARQNSAVIDGSIPLIILGYDATALSIGSVGLHAVHFTSTCVGNRRDVCSAVCYSFAKRLLLSVGPSITLSAVFRIIRLQIGLPVTS